MGLRGWAQQSKISSRTAEEPCVAGRGVVRSGASPSVVWASGVQLQVAPVPAAQVALWSVVFVVFLNIVGQGDLIQMEAERQGRRGRVGRVGMGNYLAWSSGLSVSFHSFIHSFIHSLILSSVICFHLCFIEQRHIYGNSTNMFVSSRRIKASRPICNMTYLNHFVTLTCDDLRSNFEIDLSRPSSTCFEPARRENHIGAKINVLWWLYFNIYSRKLFSQKTHFWPLTIKIPRK